MMQIITTLALVCILSGPGSASPTNSGTCLELWNNQCVADGDCCAKLYCERPESFATGVCKPELEKSGNSCKELNYNLCKVNEDCCSEFCDRPASWQFGVCKNKVEEIKIDPNQCQPLWFNQCVEHSTCCTNFCERPGHFKYGVCKPNPVPAEKKCKPLFFNECLEHTDCCSKYCDKGPLKNWKYGVCKDEAESTEKDTPQVETGACQPLWFNGCTESAKCCSGFCFMGDEGNWAVGVCKPNEGGGSSSSSSSQPEREPIREVSKPNRGGYDPNVLPPVEVSFSSSPTGRWANAEEDQSESEHSAESKEDDSAEEQVDKRPEPFPVRRFHMPGLYGSRKRKQQE